jgi:hypothetical protein
MPTLISSSNTCQSFPQPLRIVWFDLLKFDITEEIESVFEFFRVARDQSEFEASLCELLDHMLPKKPGGTDNCYFFVRH